MLHIPYAVSLNFDDKEQNQMLEKGKVPDNWWDFGCFMGLQSSFL